MDLVTVLRVALSLAVVLGLLWVSYRVAGKGARSTSKAAGAQLSVVARQGLTGKSAAVLLRSGGTQYLLGVTESSVTVIDRQDAPEVEAAEPATEAAAAPAVAPATEPAVAPATAPAVAAELRFDDAVLEAQEWLTRAGAAPAEEPAPAATTAVAPRPAPGDVLRTFLAPATWLRSAQTVWTGRR